MRLVRQRLGGLRHAARPPRRPAFLRHPDAGAERHGTFADAPRRHARDLRYAVEGFRVNAVDYLLKPISYADFLAAANKARAWFELKNRAETPPPAAAPQSLFVKTEYRLRQIGFDSILYIEGLKDYVKIHVEEETHPVLTLTSLKSLEEQLPADRFVRVHRSFIVQPSKIRSIERNRIVFGKEYIPVSENYRQAFFDFLAEHSLLF